MLIVDDSYTTKKDIQLLQDVKVKYVSLVQHGANREPFKIIKSDEGGDMAIIQSILLPLEKSLEELQEQEGLKWLAQASTSKRLKHENYQELEQAPQASFSELSDPIPLPGAPGVSIVLGTLKKEEKDKSDLLQAPPSLFAMPVATETMTYEISAGEYFFKEIEAFEKSVDGAMSQIGLTPADRSNQIMTAYKALGAFLEPWIAKVVALPDLSAVKSAFETRTKNTGGLEDMNKDELLAVLKEQNDATLAKLEAQFGAITERLEKLEKGKSADPPAAEPLTLDGAVNLFNEKLTALEARIVEVQKKQKSDDATSSATPATEPKSPAVQEPEKPTEPAVKDDGKGLPADKRAGVFGGTIFDHGKLKAAGLLV